MPYKATRDNRLSYIEPDRAMSVGVFSKEPLLLMGL